MFIIVHLVRCRYVDEDGHLESTYSHNCLIALFADHGLSIETVAATRLCEEVRCFR